MSCMQLCRLLEASRPDMTNDFVNAITLRVRFGHTNVAR
jgi:hypothetical protein